VPHECRLDAYTHAKVNECLKCINRSPALTINIKLCHFAGPPFTKGLKTQTLKSAIKNTCIMYPLKEPGKKKNKAQGY